nr:subtilisin-like protease SBT4.4 [Tanacetum cinerariifolium]
PHSMIQMQWTYETGQYVIAAGALGCIVPDVGTNVTEIITLRADATLSENDFNLVKNYTTSAM